METIESKLVNHKILNKIKDSNYPQQRLFQSTQQKIKINPNNLKKFATKMMFKLFQSVIAQKKSIYFIC